VVTEREIEIAMKVREVHGQRDFQFKDLVMILPNEFGIFLSIEAPCSDVGDFGLDDGSCVGMGMHDEMLWLPTPMDYTKMPEWPGEWYIDYCGQVYTDSVSCTCPFCGGDMRCHNHYCDNCKERIAQPDEETYMKILFTSTMEAWMKVVKSKSISKMNRDFELFLDSGDNR